MPPRRQLPVVGAPVTVAFLARRVGGTIDHVGEDGRTLTVSTEDGQALEFALNPATGYFTAGGRQEGARLLFDA